MGRDLRKGLDLRKGFRDGNLGFREGFEAPGMAPHSRISGLGMCLGKGRDLGRDFGNCTLPQESKV